MTNLVFSIVGMMVTNWVPAPLPSIPSTWLVAIHHLHRQEVQEIRHNTYLRVQQDENKWDLLLSSTVVTGIPLMKRQVPIETGWMINTNIIVEPNLIDYDEIRIGIYTNSTITVDDNGRIMYIPSGPVGGSLTVSNGVPAWRDRGFRVLTE